MTYISIDCSYYFLVGRICPLMQAHFLWPLLKRKAFLLRLNKGSNFLQSAFWIRITKRFSLVGECNVFLQCCITLGAASQFSLQNAKLSRIVTYRSKIIRVNCSSNWGYINLLRRIEFWLSRLQLSVFLKRQEESVSLLTGACSSSLDDDIVQKKNQNRNCLKMCGKNR